MHDRTNNERCHVAAAIRFHWHRAQGRWLVFFRGWPARCARVTGQRGLWARGSCCVERTARCASCWQGTKWRGGGRIAVARFFWAVASALCAGRWSARAWARGSCCVERTTRFASCWQGAGGVGEGVSRWPGLFLGGRWPARCARVAGQRGLEPAGLVVWSARLASPRAGRGRVAWGRACRGGRVFFWGGGGQRAVRGLLVSAGLGPRVVLCGAHNSLRLVLAGAW